MEEFKVEVKEVLSRIITIHAHDEDEAIDRVQKQYNDGEIVLTADDFQGDETIEIYEADKA